jgi:hypothetical protein
VALQEIGDSRTVRGLLVFGTGTIRSSIWGLGHDVFASWGLGHAFCGLKNYVGISNYFSSQTSTKYRSKYRNQFRAQRQISTLFCRHSAAPRPLVQNSQICFVTLVMPGCDTVTGQTSNHRSEARGKRLSVAKSG